jgi:AcrR family transcriptional regulator
MPAKGSRLTRVFPQDPPRPRPGGRSAQVVSNVLRTAAAELARTGYEAFRVDDVAAKTGVNKTTIYRRWPTKSALVAAVMRHIYENLGELPDTGVLREDLVTGLVELAALRSSGEQRSLARIFLTQLGEPDIAKMAQVIREQHRAPWVRAIQRAVARGELRKSANPAMLVEVIMATTFGRLSREEPVTRAFCAELVDLVLAGAGAGSRPSTTKATR